MSHNEAVKLSFGKLKYKSSFACAIASDKDSLNDRP